MFCIQLILEGHPYQNPELMIGTEGAPSKAQIRELVKIQHEERVSRHLITEPNTRSGNRLM